MTYFWIMGTLVCASAQTPETAPETDSEASNEPASVLNHFYIREYRVQGVKHLPVLEVEKAVYPFLGPRRTAEDVEQARAALQKAYDEKGYKTVTVEIPPQEPKRGVVKLLAVENTVGRLRVHGAKYFSISQIKKQVPSMAEGTVVDFNRVTKEIIALNQLADRQVSPSLKPGVEPGTVDIDLEVKDKRNLVIGTGFTVGPGLYYAGELGVRTEISVFLGKDGPEITTPVQYRVEPLLGP